MSKPAFIVDGHQEQMIIKKLCPGSPVRKLGCNGRDVNIASAVRRMATIIRTLDGKYYPIVIIFDREDRIESADSIKAKIEMCLKNEGINDQIIIGVPDRMIENWILADGQNLHLKGQLNISLIPSCPDGINGKSLIMKMLPKEGQYHETIEGVEWFLSSDPQKIYKTSGSFQAFASCIKELSCAWLFSLDCEMN